MHVSDSSRQGRPVSYHRDGGTRLALWALSIRQLRVTSGRTGDAGAQMLCALVEVERGRSHRKADVSEGPGWLGVIWPPDDPPVLRAYDAGGAEVFTLGSSLLHR